MPSRGFGVPIVSLFLPLIAASSFAATVEVTVQAPDQTPVAFAYVELIAPDRAPARPSAETVLARGNGSLTVDAGNYEVFVAAPGYQPAVVQARVTEGKRNAVFAELTHGARLTGSVSDDHGQPLAHAVVSQARVVPPPGVSQFSSMAASVIGASWATESDDAGRWTVAVPEQFQIPLIIEAPGFAPAWIHWKPKEAAPVDVALRPGGGLRATLDRTDPHLVVTLARLDAAGPSDVPSDWQPRIWAPRTSAAPMPAGCACR